MAPLVEALKADMGATTGIVDIATNYTSGKPELRLLADPARIGDLGLTNADIASSVRALINGERATVLRRDGKDTDIVVRLAPADRQNPAALGDIVIPTRSGSVTLNSLGKFELASSPVSIRRYDRLTQIIVGANLQKLNTADAQKRITEFMNAQKTETHVPNFPKA